LAGVTENYEVPVRTAALRVDNRNQNIPPLAQSKTVGHSTTKLVSPNKSKYYYYRQRVRIWHHVLYYTSTFLIK